MCKSLPVPRFAHPPLPGPTTAMLDTNLCTVWLSLSKYRLTVIDHSLTALEGWARSHQLFHFTPSKLSSSQAHCEASFFLAWGRSLVISCSNSWGPSFNFLSYHDDVSNDLFSSPCSISTFVSISCLYSSPHSDFHIAANVEAGYTLLAFIIEEEEEDFFDINAPW